MSELSNILLIIVAALWLYFTLVGFTLFMVAVFQRMKINKELKGIAKKRRDAINDNNNAD